MADLGGAHFNAGIDTGAHLNAHVNAGLGANHGMVSPYGGYPSNVGPHMVHGHCHRGMGGLGTILVLYILLVIILRGVR